MTSRFFTAAVMSHAASAAHADAASSCPNSTSFYTALLSVDAVCMASILLFVLLAGLVCVRSILGIILPLLAGVLLVCGMRGPSEAGSFA